MKTAISIPDELFNEVEACSRRLKLSRSRFFVVAAREYLQRYPAAVDATKAWNAAIEAAGQPGEEEGVARLRNRSRALIAAQVRKAR